MPGFDGSGPNFAGPMTGGARGYCTGDVPVARGGFGYGYGRGGGYGRGRGRCQGFGVGAGGWRGRSMVPLAAQPQDPWELTHLERQAAAMQRTLDAVHQRIQSLKARSAETTPPTTGGEE